MIEYPKWDSSYLKLNSMMSLEWNGRIRRRIVQVSNLTIFIINILVQDFLKKI